MADPDESDETLDDTGLDDGGDLDDASLDDADDPAVGSGGSDDEADADIADLSYEDARDELVSIVSKLEGGSAGLDERMRLWERGETLAAHCQRRLDSAEQRLDAATTDEE